MKSLPQDPDEGSTPVEVVEPQALVEAPPAELALSVLERMCLDPRVDVAKLQALIGLQHVEEDRSAKRAFTAAFAKMQQALPPIPRRGRGHNDVAYELLEDVLEAVLPVLGSHGFALSHRTEWPDSPDPKVRLIRVVGILAHKKGHERESVFLTSADTSGNKNKIQSEGSALSYGRRYTTRDLLNLKLTGLGKDDDGEGSGSDEQPDAPAGYDEWLVKLSEAAETGWAAVSALWRLAEPGHEREALDRRDYCHRWDEVAWDGIKTRAQKVDREPGQEG